MTEDVARIAAGLTKAGEIIVRRMSPGWSAEAFYLRSSADVWAPASTLAALAKRGLVERVADTCPQRYRLTPSGEQVRNYLIEGAGRE